ncbi:MAG: hypothetical protein ACRC5G_08035 [Cetobacterium sp.]
MTPLVLASSGGPAPAAGQIQNKGCAWLQLTVNYLHGADCDDCTVDTETIISRQVLVPPTGDGFWPLPEGLISTIDYVLGTVDGLGDFTPSASTKETKIHWYSYRTICCNEDYVIIA